MARRGKSFTTILKQAAREAERSRKRAERERVQKLNAMKREQAKAEKEYQKQLQKEYVEGNQNYAKSMKENAENQRNIFLKITDYIHIKDKISLLSQIREDTFDEECPTKSDKIVFSKPEYKETFISKIIPSVKRKKEMQYEKELKEWKVKCEGAKAANEENLKAFNEELENWKKRKISFYDEREKYNKSIEELNDRYNKNEQEAVEEYFELVLDAIEFPYEGLEGDYDLEYNELSKILVLDYVLPNIDVILDLKNMTYVKSRDEFNETYITEKQKEKVYNELLYGLVLKIVEVLYSKVENDSVKSIVFNGWIENINKATGNEQSFCLLSLQTKKEDFDVINLKQVDYKTCFRKLKGVSKPNLNDLVPVAPILNINTEDKRFIDNVEIGDKIEGINIANMDWKDFEYLIRELFQKEFENDGVEVKTTQASRDGGVDAIMFDPDPIKGGKYIIQAKRYNNLVGISAVRDLYGTVHNEGATKGILVTTSDFGSDSYEFVKDKPLTLINGSNLLSLLQKHNYKNVRIDLKEGK